MSVLFPEDITATDYSVVRNKMESSKVAGTPYTIQADIQPMTDIEGGELFESLPTLRRDVGHVKVYSDQQLVVAKEGTVGTGTVLDWSTSKWEIIHEYEYQKPSLFSLVDHYKYIGEYRTEQELTIDT